MTLRLHPRVLDDIDKTLEATRAQFGVEQVRALRRLLTQVLASLRHAPERGRLFPELGAGVRGLAIATSGVGTPYGFLYRVDGERVCVARLVHLARYLPDLVCSYTPPASPAVPAFAPPLPPLPALPLAPDAPPEPSGVLASQSICVSS